MKIVSFSIIGPNEADRFLEATLKQLTELADEIAICLNNADEKTRQMCLEYGDLVVEDNREWGKNQHRIKEEFLKNHVAKLNPDWIICIDGDEILDKRATRAKLEELASSPNDIAYQFWCIQLYNDDKHWRPDLSFPNVRFYKVVPELGLYWHQTPLHCGLAPEYAYKLASDSGMIFKHYGLMLYEDRQRKIARYDKYDPTGKYKSPNWYKALKNEKARLEDFEESEKFYDMLVDKNVVESHKKRNQIKNMTNKAGKIFLVRNPHGKVIPIQEGKALSETLKRPGFSLVQEVLNVRSQEAEVVTTLEPKKINELDNGNACTVCHFVGKTSSGLRLHSRKHEPKTVESVPVLNA